MAGEHGSGDGSRLKVSGLEGASCDGGYADGVEKTVSDAKALDAERLLDLGDGPLRSKTLDINNPLKHKTK
ncbi:hypothetical protein VDG1235_1994 [Verrucomicrobiia bacterium DG1235]|nr:hypothetical protein VDG1235_1994 [Verrucomicrobiae bacterium DG1235]